MSRLIRGLKTPAVWIKGLVSAGISAAAGAVVVMIADPQTFNAQDGLKKVAIVAGLSALVGVANFLKTSPLPE